MTVLRDGQMVATEDIADVSIDRIIEHMTGEPLEADGARPSRSSGHQADAPPLLEVEGLACRSVVDDVSFSVYPGEMLGVVGLMGWGRTELARAMFGIDRITAGTVRLDGRELTLSLTARRDRRRHRARAGGPPPAGPRARRTVSRTTCCCRSTTT